VRNDNFGYYVQRLNTEERNISSLVQRILSAGFLVGLAWTVLKVRIMGCLTLY
jgi:hypothetical protein